MKCCRVLSHQKDRLSYIDLNAEPTCDMSNPVFEGSSEPVANSARLGKISTISRGFAVEFYSKRQGGRCLLVQVLRDLTMTQTYVLGYPLVN